MAARDPPFSNEELERMIPHIFLPRKLPGFPPETLVQDEVNLLKLMRDMVSKANLTEKEGTCFHQIAKLFNMWYDVQHQEILDPNKLSKAIASLQPGDSFALYIRAQNACLMLSIPKDESHAPQTAIFSTFPASSRSEDIMSATGELSATFPTSSIHIPESNLLHSETFGHQLSMLDSTQCDIAMLKTGKAGSYHNEIRDVPDPMLVSKFITALLTNDESDVCTHFPIITKKVKDQISWEQGSELPFRRSGLWFSAKAVLQLSLVNGLGQCEGTFWYKLIMLRVLIQICKHFHHYVNVDISMQIVAKIAHRLCKLELLIELNNFSQLHIRAYHLLQKKGLENMKLAWQEHEPQWSKTVKMDCDEAKAHLLCGLDIECDIKHSLLGSKHYFKTAQKSTVQQTTFSPPACPPRYRLVDVGPSEFPLSHFKITGEEDTGIVLWDFEQYVRLHLSAYASVYNCQNIRTLLETYTENAKCYYYNDPVGSSHMVLTSLKIIQILDKLTTAAQPLLKKHKSGIDINIVQDLLLVNYEDLELASELESYFTNRNEASYPSIIEEETISNNSFSPIYARKDSEMTRIQQEILENAERKIAAKKIEVQNGRSKVAELRKQAREKSHSYYTETDKYGFSSDIHASDCSKCSLESRANKYTMSVYERPLPTDTLLQLAVVFELRIPKEIACLRDALYYFRTKICSSSMCGTNYPVALWTSYDEISRFYQGTQKYIKLGSTTNLSTSTNYSKLHPDGHTDDSFIVKNGFNCCFVAGSFCLSTPDKATVKNHCIFSAAQKSKYEPLSWTIRNTDHTQNQVLAKQVMCPKDLALSEFVEFGSLRAGHRLQLRNIYRALQQDTLSLHEESVFNLICQSIWQAGPQAKTALICRESHEDLNDSNFATALIRLLNKAIDQQSKNWMNYYTMLNFVVLIARTFSLAPNEEVKEAAFKILMKCRRVINVWVQTVRENLSKMKELSQENIKNLRLTFININVCAALTFWVDEINFPDVMTNSEDVKCWLTAISNIKDNIILSTEGVNSLSVPLRNLLRWVRRAGVGLENHLHNILHSDKMGMISFAKHHLPGSKNGDMDLWVSCGGLQTQIYQSKFVGSQGDAITLYMDIIRGDFLVNGSPVGYLPSAVTTHEDFQRVFSNTIFEVKTGEAGSLVADYQNRSYSFLLGAGNNLIVTETQEDGSRYQLIPQCVFKGDIPFLLNKNYSHWWNKQENSVSFRMKSFLDPGFVDKVMYKLDLNSNTLTELSTDKFFVDVNKISYKKICKIMARVEHQYHIHMLYSPEDNETIVDLPRMGLQFEIDKTGNLNSREYPGMRVKKQQTFGTFVGLKQGLLLESTDSSVKSNNIVLIPYGRVSVQLGSIHQVVQINLTKLGSTHFFAYEIDERLRELRAGESHTAWLFLALLHAATASPMVDPFTGLTGTESALRLLQSAHCWSCQPMDVVAHDTLRAIASLSPVRTYYPNNLKCMEKVEWPVGLSSMAAHDGYQMIAKKLAEDSQRLAFMFKNTGSLHISYNDELVQKSYWRHHRLCTEQARVSPAFDTQYKGLPPTAEASVFNRNLDDPNMNNVRIIAHLGYTWSVVLPPPLSYGHLKQLLISSRSKLTGVTGRTFHHSTPTASLSLNFKDSWLDLYITARNIRAKGNEYDWTVLLCYFAFMGTSIDHLQILHAVAVHPDSFSQYDPPPCADYVDVNENEFNSSCIEQVFQRHATTLDQYIVRTDQERQYLEEKLAYQNRKREIQKVHNSLVSSQVQQLTSLVHAERPTKTTWNSSMCNQSNYTEIDIKASLIEVNKYLTHWHRNRKLKLFLENVESVVFHQLLILPQTVYTRTLTQTITKPEKQCLQYKFFELTLSKLLSKDEIFITKAIDDNFLFANQIIELMAENIFSTGQANISSFQNMFSQPSGLMSNTKPFPWEVGALDKNSCVIGNSYMNDNRKSWDSYWQQSKRIINIDMHSPSFLHVLKQAGSDYSKYSSCMWVEVKKLLLGLSQSCSMKALSAARLFPRTTPSTMLPLICNIHVDKRVRNLVGATAVLWTLEQQANRCLKFAKSGESMGVALKKELATMECESSWNPCDKPEWLLLELEMDLKIRPLQVKVAKAMLDPVEGKHALMQLNMGEGKTAVIIPMVVASLANERQLCRITVLKPLFHMNREALMFKLGGLLNQRVYTFPCRRDMKIGSSEIALIRQIYKECVAKRGVVLTLPEYRLSFQLKGYEQSRNGNFQDALPLLQVQEWLKHNARDVLDESDAILHVKYQLVYTVGEQIPVGGESLRWTVAQSLLKLVPARLSQLIAAHGENAAECSNSTHNPEQFPHCRLLNLDCYRELCEMLVIDILGGKLEVQFPDLTAADRDIVAQFLTSAVINEEYHKKALEVVHSETSTRNRDVLLILRGLLACGVLLLVLNKRWRVNYGVNPNGNRYMAVPFRAKDVAAERTEFGHPDVAILSTIMSYYYSGLTDTQLDQCFELLYREQSREQEYEQWVRNVRSIHPSIKHLSGVNLADCEQLKDYLQPALLKNMAVVDFWLGKVVFPKEAKQFGWKMLCSPWDLCADDTVHPVTGFSGTNDTKLLLPINICQNDLPELLGTNGEVLHNLLLPENNNYAALPIGSTNADILQKLVDDNIPLLLDVGALMTEYSNKNLAIKWLNHPNNSTKNAAIYFDEEDKLVVIDKRARPCLFELSPYRRRMEECVIYLDDFHTRGTDLKIPRGTKGCVTLGKGLTKDKLVQGCMRMRMLGEGHTVCFWASKEVNGEIINLTGKSEEDLTTKDVLTWAMENSRLVTRDGFLHWVVAGFNHTMKKVAHTMFNASEKSHDDIRMLGENCSDKEVIDLVKMYGLFCREEFFPNIAYFILQAQLRRVENLNPRKAQSNHFVQSQKLCIEVGEKIVQRCEKFVSTYKRLSHLLDEEQERELEHELEEERSAPRPLEAKPADSRLNGEVVKFIRDGIFVANNDSNWCMKLPCVFQKSTFWPCVQADCWGENIYATKDFVTVVKIETQKDCIDQFLRPPAWVAALTTRDNLTIFLILSPFEVNELLPHLRSGRAAAVLHMFAARLRRGQDTLLQCPLIMLPSSTSTPIYKEFGSLYTNLSIFGGNLYFADEKEQDDYTKVLGIIPRPRTQKEQEAFDKGWTSSGFVKPKFRDCLPEVCSKFLANPEPLVRSIIAARHAYFPSQCHVSRLIVELRKPFSDVSKNTCVI